MPKKRGKRSGEHRRTTEQTRAYRPIVDAARRQYDGSHGFRNAAGEWQTFVTVGRTRDGFAGQVLPDGSRVNSDLGRNDESKIADMMADKLPQFRGIGGRD